MDMLRCFVAKPIEMARITVASTPVKNVKILLGCTYAIHSRETRYQISKITYVIYVSRTAVQPKFDDVSKEHSFLATDELLPIKKKVQFQEVVTLFCSLVIGV